MTKREKDRAETAWIEILRAACVAGSQRDVARKVGYSVTVVSQVLSGTYKGDLLRVKAAVEGALMQHEVECPVCGIIPRQRCVEHQRKPLLTTSTMRIALYKACRGGCPNALHSNSAPHPTRNAQPAVASNTGSTDGGVPSFTAGTVPTGPRKGLSHLRKNEVQS